MPKQALRPLWMKHHAMVAITGMDGWMDSWMGHGCSMWIGVLSMNMDLVKKLFDENMQK